MVDAKVGELLNALPASEAPSTPVAHVVRNAHRRIRKQAQIPHQRDIVDDEHILVHQGIFQQIIDRIAELRLVRLIGKKPGELKRQVPRAKSQAGRRAKRRQSAGAPPAQRAGKQPEDHGRRRQQCHQRRAQGQAALAKGQVAQHGRRQQHRQQQRSQHPEAIAARQKRSARRGKDNHRRQQPQAGHRSWIVGRKSRQHLRRLSSARG